MKNVGIIYKIKSIYIVKNIFNYIKDNNIQLKLFIHSNYFQNELNIKYIYKEKYLNKIGFNLEDYIHIEQNEYKKNILKKKYDNFIIDNKLNKEKIQDIIFEILENKKIKDIDEDDVNIINEKLINFDSPLFEIISKTKLFEKNFTIYISQKNIDDYKLKNDYIIFFDKLNKSNIKYSSLFYKFNDKNKINYLEEFNIDFNKIKKLTLIEDDEEGNIYENNNYFFGTLFSLNNIESNLIYLKICFKNIDKDECQLSPKLFENINNFKSLRYLYIKSFNLNENIIIKLSDNFCQKLKLLDLGWNKISNINIFENANFKELKELNLSHNNIADIKVLEKVKIEKIKVLNLGSNKILNINILKTVNFKELKILNLSNNKISDIKILEKVKFEKLVTLNLGSNNISDINILENVNFKELKELYLYNNNIFNLKTLEKVKFEKLEILDLSWNEISDINILKNVNFKELKKLDLSYNKILDIKILDKVKFEKLEILNLGSNTISDINILEKVNFKELKELNLFYNEILDIKVLEKVKFELLETLNLRGNKISDINILENVNLKKLKELDLSDHHLSDIKVLEKVTFKVNI